MTLYNVIKKTLSHHCFSSLKTPVVQPPRAYSSDSAVRSSNWCQTKHKTIDLSHVTVTETYWSDTNFKMEKQFGTFRVRLCYLITIKNMWNKNPLVTMNCLMQRLVAWGFVYFHLATFTHSNLKEFVLVFRRFIRISSSSLYKRFLV